MAFHENASIFQLNIKVNNENLQQRTKKYNVGSLKLPADPSWPKIPHRKLAEDAGDIIEPPCIVTLTGTPKRSRTIIHTQYQTSKSLTIKDSINNPTTTHCQKTTLMHIMKRRPGSVDPRFKRVTMVKSQVAAGHLLEHEHDKLKDITCSALTIPNQTLMYSEKLENTALVGDTNTQQVIQQEMEKLDEVSCIKVSNAHQIGSVCLQHINDSEGKCATTERNTENYEISKELFGGTTQTKTVLQSDMFRPKNISDNISKRKLQTPPESHNGDAYCNDSRNDADHANIRKNSNTADKLNQNKIGDSYSVTESELHQNDPHQQRASKNCSKFMFPGKDKHITQYNETMDSHVHIRKSGQCSTTPDNVQIPSMKDVVTKNFVQNHDNNMYQTLESDAPDLKHLHKEGSHTIAISRYTLNSQENGFHAEVQSTSQHMQISEPHVTSKQRRAAMNISRKAKSYFQRNARSVVAVSDCTLIWPGSHHKRKYSQENVAKCTVCKKDSVCFSQCEARNEKTNAQNLISPTNPKDKLKVELRQNSAMDQLRTSVSSVSLKKQFDRQTDASHIPTDDTIEKPTKLSLKTQHLLNKNYWEYYNKLKHKRDCSNNTQQNYHSHTTISGPRMRKDGSSHNDDRSTATPEVQTLEQCSILSTMINKTLGSAFHESGDTLKTRQLYVNGNVKSSTDPTGGTQSAIPRKKMPEMPINIYEDSIVSSTFSQNMKYEAETAGDQRLLKLKTIICFGSMMYGLIVFLPMLYDYFFYEEYDDYHNMGYTELVLKYVISSFTEAFGDFFNVINNTFFQPVRRKINF